MLVLKSGKIHKQVRLFGTTTDELISLRERLLSEDCTHVAMERKHGGVLEADLRHSRRSLRDRRGQRQHVKKVPGRKTDVKDAEWIADLLCHGLLRASFVPSPREW